MLTQKLEGAAKSTVPAYIEDVFSTYLYTGNGSTQTITNGIDLAGKGGLVWGKPRNQLSDHFWVDTARGANNWIRSNTTNAQAARATVSAFGATGFTVDAAGGYTNDSGINYASWTFRKQPKFFDVVTYTGNGVDNRDIAHSLGSTPGCIIVKNLTTATAWRVWHTSLTAGNNLELNATDGQFADTAIKSCTSTTFRTNSGSNSNSSGNTYVAYLFAHNAGGFGLTGTDNVISCGAYTGAGAPLAVTLGYEPQWVMMKNASGTGNWIVIDNMRGMPVTGITPSLFPNLANAENTTGNFVARATATGFIVDASTSDETATYIYIAIRRGPMKTPTTGTSVFAPVARTGTGAAATVTGLGFTPDSVIAEGRGNQNGPVWYDRLRGPSAALRPNQDNSEYTADTTAVTSFNMDGISFGADSFFGRINQNAMPFANWFFKRAPGFFDEICYTGNGTSGRSVPHNLAAVPELIICKQRSTSSGTRNWIVYAQPLGSSKYLYLNDTMAAGTVSNIWGTQTSTTFGVENFAEENDSGQTFVAYLFASCPGVSKVGSYTGTGTTQTINCGFTGGARFVLIKRTDASGDWYVWDSARGIVAGNDPYLLLNSSAAEMTNTDYIDAAATGFEISSTAPAAINASGGTFIFLAIA